MKSFRLQFIDIDSSYTISTTEAAIKGFIVVRAPKGTTEAMYFPYGNEKSINAMIGLPTANWIDIYEAVAFNQEYGLYISAPPGTGTDHPSYYGGVYFTTRGPYDYWQVSDDTDPSFEICLNLGSEYGSWGSDATTSEIEITRLSDDYSYTTGGTSISVDNQALIKISNLSAKIFARTSYFNLNYWGADDCPVDAGVVTYTFDGTTTQGNIYYVDPDEGTNKDVTCGIYKLDGSTYTIYLGGSTSENVFGEQDKAVSTNKRQSNAPWLSFKNLFNYEVLKNTTGNATTKSIDITADDGSISITEVNIAAGEYYPFMVNGMGDIYSSQDAIASYIKSTVLNGLSSNVIYTDENGRSFGEIEAFDGIEASNRIQYRVNIKDITFCRIHQKSPNETPTYVSVSNIGYDKWKYDQQAAWISVDNISGKSAADGTTVVSQGTITSSNISKTVLDSALQSAIIQGNSDGLVIVALGDSTSPKNRLTVFQLDSTSGLLSDVTSSYLTQRFYINMEIQADFSVTSSDVSDPYTYTVWEIVSSSSKGMGKHTSYQCTEDSSTYPLKTDINYNTLTVSCKEVVIPGEYTSGGEFTGSLSETGVDSYGSNIYWPNILPDNAVTFIEVVPVATFDDLNIMNDQGFFTGTKILDPIGPAKDLYTNYITGQRYCTYVNELNQKDGILGSAWRDEYYQIIKDGIIEAQNPEYEDALIFMEPTGYEDFKSLLMSLRVKYHDTSTVISPKIITKAELANPKTITVSGRSKGVAQYIGEFRKYDTYTGKYYYCQPIGDVGLQLARIMDKKLGGIAPAGTNDSSGLGGCLSRSVLSAKWQFNDDALQILDEKGLCAITYDADYGLMIQSQKSTQDPSTVTDWSYLGHSMSFDLCKREIRDKVMTQQLFKRISPTWMDIRTKQVQAILDKRTTGSDPIWASATVDITGQNTSTTMAKHQFVIKVTCKVYVYSETVLLIFENLPQE